MNEQTHEVKLPYPDRTEPTVARCCCGWITVYRWGRHGQAQAEAEQHVRREALAEPYVLEQSGGTRHVRAGRSL